MEIKRKIKIKMSFIFFIKLLEILLLNNIIKGCPIDQPILDSTNTCVSKFCTNNDFKTSECKIDNDIIETQWLTRLNLIGENGYRMVSIATFSNNGDLILETITDTNNKKRYFYGLNKNGNYLFQNEQGKPFYLMDVNNNIDSNPYFNIFTVFSNKENNNDKKEYLIFISKSTNLELYDLENKKAYIEVIPDINSSTSNIKYMPFKIIEDDKIYTIFATIKSDNFILLKFNVDD